MTKPGKKKKVISIISRVLWTIFVLVSLVLLGILVSMNILPVKYLLPILIIYLLFVAIFAFFVWKKKTKSWLKIFSSILFVLGTLVCSFGLYYLSSTLNLMDKIRSKDYQVEDYYVLVLKDSSYLLINDLKDKTLGSYKSEIENYNTAKEEVHSKTTVKDQEYEDFMVLADDLLEKKVDAILVSAVNKDMIEEEKENFENNVRIIYTASLKIKNETVVKEAKVTEESFNIYISGIDIYGDISSVSRSDVNIIATVNPTTHKVLLTTIPRDYYVQLHGTTGYKDKLTHAGIYGIDMSIQTIEDLLDIDINYYVRVNFTTLINLVDAIDGIDVVSDYNFTAASGDKFKKGTNHMNGKQALAFSRERHAFKDGDRQRGKNQQKVITAIINKAMSSKTLITKYTNILNSLGNSFQTNMDTSKIYQLVNMQLDKMPSWNIESISLDGSDSRNYTYSYKGSQLYVMEPKMETVNAAKAQIDLIESEK